MLEALQIEMSEKCIEWNRRASGSQAEGTKIPGKYLLIYGTA
jgi:hypothetical protein